MRILSLCFAAGCFGGLLNGLVVWLSGAFGITGAFNVDVAPALTPGYLYQRIVWGGIWGFLFLLPYLRGRLLLLKGVVLSLAPTLVQLLIVFPIKGDAGMFGYRLGSLTWVFVIIFNLVWGIAAAAWLLGSGARKEYVEE